MAKPYSNDLRERVVAAVEREGLSRNQAAARFGVAVSTAINWVRRFRETGRVTPGQIGGHKPRILSGAHRDWLLERTASGISRFVAWLPSWLSEASRWITIQFGTLFMPRA